MFRSDLHAAHARIASLENDLAQARAQASAEANERIAELEAELAQEQSRAAKLERPRSHVWYWLAAGAAAAVIGISLTVAVTLSCESGCDAGRASDCVCWGLELEHEHEDPRRAEIAYARACELGSPVGCYNQGVLAYWQRNDVTTAVAAGRKACERDYAEACANLSALVEDDAEKRSFADKACKLGSPLGCSNLASRFTAAKEWTAALPFARQGCDGGSVGGCTHLAYALLMTGDENGALAAATRGVQINQQHPGARTTLGHVLVIHGDVDEAINSYRRALALEHRAGGNERPMLDRPIATDIKEDLGELRLVHPDRSAAIDLALRRLSEDKDVP